MGNDMGHVESVLQEINKKEEFIFSADETGTKCKNYSHCASNTPSKPLCFKGMFLSYIGIHGIHLLPLIYIMLIKVLI